MTVNNNCKNGGNKDFDNIKARDKKNDKMPESLAPKIFHVTVLVSK